MILAFLLSKQTTKLVTSRNVSFPKLFYVKYFFANDGDKNRGGDTIRPVSHPVYRDH